MISQWLYLSKSGFTKMFLRLIGQFGRQSWGYLWDINFQLFVSHLCRKWPMSLNFHLTFCLTMQEQKIVRHDYNDRLIPWSRTKCQILSKHTTRTHSFLKILFIAESSEYAPWWKTLLLRSIFMRCVAVSLSGACPVWTNHLTISRPIKQHW